MFVWFMKTFNVLLILASLFIGFSCQKSSDLEFTTAPRLDGKTSINERGVNDDVQKLALDVATILKTSDELRGAKALTISSVYNLRDETDLRSLSSSKLDLRVVEFANNEGYALISGGRRVIRGSICRR